MGRKNREARRLAEKAARQVKKNGRMSHPHGTSAYALKKKHGVSNSSPFFKPPEESNPRSAESLSEASAERRRRLFSWW